MLGVGGLTGAGCVAKPEVLRRGLRFLEELSLIWRHHEPFLEQMVPSVAGYVISPEGMAHRIFATVLDSVQTGLVSTATHSIMPEFTEGETLGPGLAPARV